jgi:NTP pyrophosphatase (non-canonical NTP hydrolase)
MDLNKIINLQIEFDKRHIANEEFYVPLTSSNPRDLEHLVVCTLGELGEFANILKKVVRGDLTYEAAEPQLSEELTDVFIYLIKIAGQSGIDLEASFLKKLSQNESRFAKWRKD